MRLQIRGEGGEGQGEGKPGWNDKGRKEWGKRMRNEIEKIQRKYK